MGDLDMIPLLHFENHKNDDMYFYAPQFSVKTQKCAPDNMNNTSKYCVTAACLIKLLTCDNLINFAIVH